MKLSVSAWSVQKVLFGKTLKLVEFIDFCHENGVDAVELLDCFWEDEGHIQEIKKHLVNIKMPVSAYSIGNNFVQDEKGRQEQIEYVKKGIDTAVFLETKTLRVFSGDAAGEVSFEKGRKWIIDSFKICSEYAQKKGITMVLENHGMFAGKSSQVRDIIESVGSAALRANADTGNFLLVGENPLDAVKHLHELVAFVHFKDLKKTGSGKGYAAVDGTIYEGTVIGDGEVPMKEIIDYLYAVGYDGYLSIEFEGEGDPLEGTLESIRFTKKNIK